MAKVCLGVDFGGTFIKFGLLANLDRPCVAFQVPTPLGRGPEAIVEAMAAGGRRLIDEKGLSRGDIAGVGIGSPGPLSVSRGVLLNLPNVPGMENFPLRDRLAGELDMPVVLENDANAAAMGELLCGAGKGCRDMVMLTLGTGVGSGIIHDGRIIHGASDMGGELGHMIVQPGGRECSCGQKGCLEQYCSATNIAVHAERLIRDGGESSSLAGLLERNGGFDARDINQARLSGDDLAGKVWDELAYYLAVGCVNICRIFDPERIILAGGLSKAGDDLLAPTRKYWRNLNWNLLETRTELAIAVLGSDAGVIGAAGVAQQNFATNV